jgi:hypothetical protein
VPFLGSVDDMVDLAMGTDVLKSVMHYMKEFDPSFQLPEGFFPRSPRQPHRNGEKKISDIIVKETVVVEENLGANANPTYYT